MWERDRVCGVFRFVLVCFKLLLISGAGVGARSIGGHFLGNVGGDLLNKRKIR